MAEVLLGRGALDSGDTMCAEVKSRSGVSGSTASGRVIRDNNKSIEVRSMAKRSPKTKAKPTEKKAGTVPAKSHQSPDWPVLALAALGMAITAYLTAVAWWDAAPAFCSAGSSCDLIAQSRWSQVLGLPLALWGLLLYSLIAFIAYRSSAPMKRWKRVWSVALIGLVFSIYLTLVGAVMLDAFCVWCLISLVTLAAIFVVNALRHPPEAPGMPWWTWLLNSAIAALVAVVALHLYYNSDLLSPPPDPRLAPLAAHLRESGAKFYGASWCASCQRQKQLFGDVADELPYVECSPYGRGGPTAAACTQANIQNFPTWVIGGERSVGVLEPDALAKRSGFAWKQN